MSKKMTPLQALKKVKKARYFVDFELDAKVGEDYKEELKIIESALNEKEQQDNALKVLKEVIEFATVLPEVKPNKDDVFSVVSAVSINIQRAIDNKERELLRQWVLDTCFPKELKEYKAMKQAKIVVADDKVNEEDLKKLINQKMFTTNLQPCKINLLFDEETRKKLKALEIIKEKRTDVGYLMSCDFLCDYNDCDETPYDKPLTQEEYDLLREVLLCQQ